MCFAAVIVSVWAGKRWVVLEQREILLKHEKKSHSVWATAPELQCQTLSSRKMLLRAGQCGERRGKRN